MDIDNPSPAPRKSKYAPKAPPKRRNERPPQPKIEVADDDADDEATAKALRRRISELGRRAPKVEKKSSVQVTFGRTDASSTSLRTFGKRREGNSDKTNGLKDLDFDSGQSIVASTASADGTSGSSVDVNDASSKDVKKEYEEPWDYHHSYYPVTLPLRMLYSGDPETLDKAEFGKTAANFDYDENITNTASELGILEENEKVQMLFLQLPPQLPFVKRSAAASAKGKDLADGSEHFKGAITPAMAKGKEKVGSSSTKFSPRAKGKEIVGSSLPSYGVDVSEKGCHLEELPRGYMGKMLVYKSGKIKLKLGDNLYDVSPGSDCVFAQDVAAINTIDKDCCVIGELGKRAVVTPDLDSLLDNVIDLG